MGVVSRSKPIICCGFVASFAIGLVLTLAAQPGAGRMPLTITTQVRRFDSQGRLSSEYLITDAVRSDGSVVRSSGAMTEAAQFEPVREVVSIPGKRVTMYDPLSRTAYSQPLAGGRRQAQAGPISDCLVAHRAPADATCEPISGTLFGLRLHRLRFIEREADGNERLREALVARELEWRELNARVVAGGRLRTERVVVNLQLGEPPDSTFEIAPGTRVVSSLGEFTAAAEAARGRPLPPAAQADIDRRASTWK